jgi:iron(III) transport system ATP-binding protein
MLPPNKRDTATMFQSYGLFPHMTVFDNVAYGLKLRKVPSEQIKTRVEETLEMVGLKDYGDRAPSKLSGGQQQRVALARSLIVTPSVLLLDEPLSNLDALLREQMRVEIRKIQKHLGITAIYVTHDRVEAMSLSDRVVVMKAGKIRQIGTPSEVYESPKDRFVAGFVGKVTFFPVSVLGHDGKQYSVQLGAKKVVVSNSGEKVNVGENAVLMARPESLRVIEPQKGNIEGKVKMNVYLGNSLESFITTDFGEVLVQIDDPHSKKVFCEGDDVSIDFSPDRVRLLNENIE